MSPSLRILLVLVAAVNLVSVIRKIRKSKMLIDYSVFWILLSLLLVILAIFPQITFWAAHLIGIQSPANFVFALLLFVLLARNFSDTIHLSTQETKLKELAQTIALKEHENDT